VIIMHTNILVLTFADDAHAAYRRASRSIEMIAKIVLAQLSMLQQISTTNPA